jgi:O-antigen ligase
MFAQAGASAAVSLGFFRRNVPSVVLAVLIAAALCGLAVMLRSGSHAAWLAGVTAQSGYVAVGLFRFADARYLGGTLLAIITLGTLLHPAVSRAFAARPDWSQAADHPAMASSAVGESGS